MTTFQEVLASANKELAEAQEAVAQLNDAMVFLRDAGESTKAMESDFNTAQAKLARIQDAIKKHIKP